MCFVLYAGTTKPLARRAWQKEAPDLCVASLTERDAPIKGTPSSPEVQYVGSTSGCGCDFPNVNLHKGESGRSSRSNLTPNVMQATGTIERH